MNTASLSTGRISGMLRDINKMMLISSCWVLSQPDQSLTLEMVGVGGNHKGQLGYDSTASVGDGTPGRSITDMGDVNVGGTVVQLRAGFQHTCVKLDTGAVRCWGNADYGQIGYDTTDEVGDGHLNREIVTVGDVPIGT
jgi:alpha-tubulin suppressor-like RCC1 family protein